MHRGIAKYLTECARAVGEGILFKRDEFRQLIRAWM